MNIIIEKNKYLNILLSFLVVLSFYSFGNFGFLNLYNIKLEVQLFILITTIPFMLLYILKIELRTLKEPLILLILYSFFSQVILKIDNILSVMQVFISCIFVIFLFILKPKYINLIIKGIVFLCFLFSFMALLQFVLLQIDSELIKNMQKLYSSTTHYIDLSDSNGFSRLGFIIDGNKHSLLFFETYRFKSFATEPSVMVYSFMAVGIVALTFSRVYKYYGFIILLFIVTLPYSGVIHLSLIFSFLIYIYLLVFKKYSNQNLSDLLLFLLLLAILLISIFYNIFIELSPSWKIGSSSLRFSAISVLFYDILSNPLVRLDIPNTLPTSFILNRALVLPIVGIILSILVFKKLFFYLISVYKYYRLYSILSLGMFFQLGCFSEYGWTSLPGWTMLTLMYLRSKYLLNEINCINCLKEKENEK